MADFTQLQEDHSILSETPVASRAKGAEALAQGFGALATGAMQGAVTIQKEHSQAMLMQSSSQANEIMTNAQLDMMKNPMQASSIAEKADSLLQDSGNVPMGSRDRSRFNYLNTIKRDKLRLQAGTIDARQNKLVSQAGYISSNTSLGAEYLNLLNVGDHKSSEIIRNNLMENGKNAVMSGLITPAAFQKNMMALDAMTEKSLAIHNHAGSGEATAAQYNSAINNPLENQGLNAQKMVPNAGTQALHYARIEAMSNEEADYQIYKGNASDPRVQATLMNQKNNKLYESFSKIDGTSDAMGVINSNVPFTHVSQKLTELNSNSDLSPREKAEFHVLNNYIKDLKQDFWKTQSNTALGFEATNKWIQDSAAALSSGGSVDEQHAAVQAADQAHMDSGIAMAETQHMSLELTNPIHKDIVNDAKTSFNMGADPSMLIDKMKYLKGNQRPYLAKQFDNKKQMGVGLAIANGLDNNGSTEFQKNMILANQSGIDYQSLNVKEDGTPKTIDSNIRLLIQSAIPDALSSLSVQKNGKDLVDGTVESGVNYIKYMAIKNNDFQLKHINDYVKDYKNEMGKSYDMATGYNYRFNRSQLNLPNREYETLSNGVINSAIKYVRSRNKGWTDEDQQNYVGNSVFNVSLSPFNKVVVSDQVGNIIFSTQYSNQLLAHAKQDKESLSRRFAVVNKQGSLLERIGETLSQQQNFSR